MARAGRAPIFGAALAALAAALGPAALDKLAGAVPTGNFTLLHGLLLAVLALLLVVAALLLHLVRVQRQQAKRSFSHVLAARRRGH